MLSKLLVVACACVAWPLGAARAAQEPITVAVLSDHDPSAWDDDSCTQSPASSGACNMRVVSHITSHVRFAQPHEASRGRNRIVRYAACVNHTGGPSHMSPILTGSHEATCHIT